MMCYIKNEKLIMGEKWMNTVVSVVMGSTSDWGNYERNLLDTG